MSKRMVSQENSLKIKKLMQQQSLTNDLFGIESCPNCNGSGQIEFIEEERIENCDICNGDQ